MMSGLKSFRATDEWRSDGRRNEFLHPSAFGVRVSPLTIHYSPLTEVQKNPGALPGKTGDGSAPLAGIVVPART